MTRKIKKSLIAALAISSISSYSLASDSFVDSISEGKLKTAIKSYYFIENYDTATASGNTIWANGASINYKTKKYMGLNFGITGQASTVSSEDDPNNKQVKSMNAEGFVVSEAYLDYKLKNTSFKGGRQFISLPLIKGSGSRLVKESFEGYFLINKDLPNTLISLGKVTKYQTRTDMVTKGTNAASFTNSETNKGDIGEFHEIGTDGAISFYLKNSSVKNLKLQAHYVDFVDEVSTLYVDTTYKFSGDLKPFAAMQYYGSKYDDSSKEDGSLVGYKIGATIAGTKIHLSHTSTSDKGSVTRGIGEAATASFTSASSTTGNYTAGTDTTQIALAKKFGKLATSVKYTKSDAVLTKNDLTQTYLGLKYKLAALKGMKLSLDYTNYDYGTGNESKNKDEFRIKAIYSF